MPDTNLKEQAEFSFWQGRFKSSKGQLANDHYKFAYTTYFDLNDEDYHGKSILDIGCGPRGSLEWADMTAKRVGLDPLIDRYKELGIDAHKMSYIRAFSEDMPLPSSAFDFVTSFNSLDHVNDISQTIREVHRVLKKDGTFLLITEINHPATSTEPHSLSPAFVQDLGALFSPIDHWFLQMPETGHGLYGFLNTTPKLASLDNAKPAWLCYKGLKKEV